MNKRVALIVLGFFLAGSGLYALFLSLVGVQLNYLVWLDMAGGLVGFVGRLLMVMAGSLFIVLGTIDWRREEAEVKAYAADRDPGLN